VRFHLIDRVEEIEPGKSIRARKVTSLSEEYWEPAASGDGAATGAGSPAAAGSDAGQGGERLVMPPPFAFEALCQAGTWLIMITTERRKRAALLSVGSVSWHRDVGPGEILELIGEVDSFGEDTAVISGRVESDGELVLEASEIMCALIDADDLADLEDTRRLGEMLTRGVEGAAS